MAAIEKRNIPYWIAAIGFIGLAVVIWGAYYTAPPQTTAYEIIKNLVAPLISPIVAILLPTVLFYLIPLWQTREKLTIELFGTYHTEKMRKARSDAWTYFVVERRSLPSADADARLDAYLTFLTQESDNHPVSAAEFEMYQKLSRVLDFFNIVNTGLERGSLDSSMVRSFLGYYYMWWKDDLLQPLHRRPRVVGKDDPRYEIQWLGELKALDTACRRSAK